MFSKKRALSLLLCGVLMFSSVLTACTPAKTDTSGTGSTTSPASEGATDAPAKTGLYPGTPVDNEITINLASEPVQMLSTLTTDAVSMDVLRHLSDGLTTLDQNDKAVPAIATAWTISDDKLTYTFKLRDDYVWTNGEKVTANDFVFTYRLLMTPSVGAEYAYLGYVFKNGLEVLNGKAKIEDLGVKAIDEYTLEITVAQPTPYLLDLLAFAVMQPINEKAYIEFGEKYGSDADKMVTNGAYTMESWEHESGIVLKKSATYPRASEIAIEKINFVMIKDTNTMYNAFKSGEIDMTALTGDQREELIAQKQPITSFDDGGNWYFEFNMNRKFGANQKLRQALTLVIDTQVFVEKLVKNDSLAATSFTSPVIQGNKESFHKELGPLFTYDLEKAKTLMAEAKKELGTDTIAVSLLVDDGDKAAKYAAFLQEAWKTNLGVDTTIDVQPFKSRIAKMAAKDFDIVFAGWSPDYNDPMTFLDMFETGNGNNHTGYSSPEYDALLNKVRVEADRDKRFGYLMELEKLLMTDMPIGPVYFRQVDYVTSDKVQGAVRTAFQNYNFRWATTK